MKEKHDLRSESNEENPSIAVTVVGSRTVTTKELTQAMRGAQMKSAGPTRTKLLTMEEVEERLTAHFATHEVLHRSEMESICECTRYRATQLINAFIEAGKLRAAGRKNVRYYLPVEW